jgi:hypothetical protein
MSERDWVSRVTALLAPYLESGAFDHAMSAYQAHGHESPDDYAQDEIDALGSYVDAD